MSERGRLVKIQLCGIHEFSDSKIAASKSPKFVTCEKGCSLEWGECEDTNVVKWGFEIRIRLVK